MPSAERSIFLKTGSDGTTASIRIARAYTNRVKVMRCGYHGWHDWSVEMKGGIPEKLYEDVHEFRYNDLTQLEDLMAKTWRSDSRHHHDALWPSQPPEDGGAQAGVP